MLLSNGRPPKITLTATSNYFFIHSPLNGGWSLARQKSLIFSLVLRSYFKDRIVLVPQVVIVFYEIAFRTSECSARVSTIAGSINQYDLAVSWSFELSLHVKYQYSEFLSNCYDTSTGSNILGFLVELYGRNQKLQTAIMFRFYRCPMKCLSFVLGNSYYVFWPKPGPEVFLRDLKRGPKIKLESICPLMYTYGINRKILSFHEAAKMLRMDKLCVQRH